MKKITSRTAELIYNESERILYVRPKEGVEVELEHAVENYEISRDLTGGGKYLQLLDLRPSVHTSREARIFSAEKKRDDGRIAAALLVKSTSSKLLATFYINFNKPKVPTKIFSSEEQAISWLNSFLFLTELDHTHSIRPAALQRV